MIERQKISDTTEGVLRLWHNGLLGVGEYHARLLQTISPANLQEFLRLVPTDVLEELKKQVATAPTTDEAWCRTIAIRSWCGPWNDEIAARVRAEDEQSLKRYRIGVETLRDHFRQTKSSSDRPL
jgi:hypothetical protein